MHYSFGSFCLPPTLGTANKSAIWGQTKVFRSFCKRHAYLSVGMGILSVQNNDLLRFFGGNDARAGNKFIQVCWLECPKVGKLQSKRTILLTVIGFHCGKNIHRESQWKFWEIQWIKRIHCGSAKLWNIFRHLFLHSIWCKHQNEFFQLCKCFFKRIEFFRTNKILLNHQMTVYLILNLNNTTVFWIYDAVAQNEWASRVTLLGSSKRTFLISLKYLTFNYSNIFSGILH